MDSHQARLQHEVDWYQGGFRPKHILNQWPFYSQRRNDSAYAVAKTELMRVASQRIPEPGTILVAPCGACADYPFIRAVWPNAKLTGIDIAPCSSKEDIYVGDILSMPLRGGTFDVVISALFFHHIADEGFAAYLNELRRVLRVGGHLITMEQSMFHPLFALTRPLMHLFRNPTGQVPHEHPISLGELARECRQSGFRYAESFACSFAHNRLPAPLRVINKIPLPKHLAWQVGLIAQK